MLYFISQQSCKAVRVGNGILRNESSLMCPVKIILIFNMLDPLPLSEVVYVYVLSKTYSRTVIREYDIKLCFDIKILFISFTYIVLL